MISFTALILKFDQKGDKTGWTYLDIPAHLAEEMFPGNKKSFRVKGRLDAYLFSGIALLPMGDGDFIMALNSEIRKAIRKEEGAMVEVSLEVDKDYSVVPPAELMDCLEDEPESLNFFNSLPKSHRDYFIKWIDSAKTRETREKRIVNTINAMGKRQSYSEMIRSLKNNR